jgi:hypothetical protein
LLACQAKHLVAARAGCAEGDDTQLKLYFTEVRRILEMDHFAWRALVKRPDAGIAQKGLRTL